jgi:hypothetical protein
MSANDMRYQSTLLADELRQSSDDLTRMARTYVITSMRATKKTIRTFWTSAMAENPARPDTSECTGTWFWAKGCNSSQENAQSIALLKLMQDAGFTDEEFKKLALAKGKFRSTQPALNSKRSG